MYDFPLEHLLGELAIDIPGNDDPTISNTAEVAQARALYLSKALSERTRKAADVRRDVQSEFEGTAMSYLTDASKALQLVRDSVLAESPYAEVHLVDPGIESSIIVMAQEVHNVSSRLETAEREAAALARIRDAKKEEILSRWGTRV